MTKKTADMIDLLAGDLTPVQPRMALWKTFLPIFAFMLFMMAGWVLLENLRPWTATTMDEIQFYLILLLATVGLAGVGTVLLSTPDTRYMRPAFALLALAVLGWLAVSCECLLNTTWGHLLETAHHLVYDGSCWATIMAASAVLAVPLYLFLKRLAPLNPNMVAVGTILTSTAAASTGRLLICPTSEPAHLLLAHFLPILLMVILSLPILPRLLRW
ncbi:MAG: NrsF family protein [Alphaproteobacteria bacterium]|nr:NrsF family protein [Alphaproteobacteria bacterium]MDD9919498.1 NrsF family protein [Alphaproteobacteria bacterium]